MRSLLSPLALLPLVAGSAAAQTSLLVVDDDGGPGVDFTSIQDAVDAAGGGDVIVVRDGVYGAFTIAATSLTVVADAGAAPQVQARIEVRDLLAHQAVFLRGLEVPFNVAPTGGPHEALTVTDCAGAVRVEDCLLHGGNVVGLLPFGEGARVSASADVSFHRTTLRGRVNEGLWAVDSGLALDDCVVEGHGNSFPTGNPGAFVLGGTLLVQGGTLRGADGSDAGLVWNPFNETFTCSSAIAGGPGLRLGDSPAPPEGGPAGAAPVVWVRGATLTGGAGGAGQLDCPTADDGVGAQVDAGSLLALPGASRDFHVREAPVVAGATYHYDVLGLSGDLAFVLFSGASTRLELPPFGLFHLDLPWAVLTAGVVPPSGDLELPFTGADLGLAAFAIPHQAVVGADGVYVFTAPSVLVLLGP